MMNIEKREREVCGSKEKTRGKVPTPPQDMKEHEKTVGERTQLKVEWCGVEKIVKASQRV